VLTSPWSIFKYMGNVLHKKERRRKPQRFNRSRNQRCGRIRGKMERGTGEKENVDGDEVEHVMQV
jgi:hypothetical protein